MVKRIQGVVNQSVNPKFITKKSTRTFKSLSRSETEKLQKLPTKTMKVDSPSGNPLIMQHSIKDAKFQVKRGLSDRENINLRRLNDRSAEIDNE